MGVLASADKVFLIAIMGENNDMSCYIPYIFVIIFLIITVIACWEYAFQDIEYTNRTTDNKEGLLPCPFCESNKVIVVEDTDYNTTDSSYYVRCNNCGATTKYFYVCSYCELDDCDNCDKDNCLPPEAIQEAKLHAIRAWNRRV